MLRSMRGLHYRNGRDASGRSAATGSLRLPGAVTLLIALALPGLTASSPGAAGIGPEQSLRICHNWLELYSSARLAVSSGSDEPSRQGTEGESMLRTPVAADVWELRHDGRLVARCYPLDPRGHVLVAADGSLPPVPAFSLDADLDPRLSPDLAQLLALRLALVLDELTAGPSETRERIRASWEMLDDTAFDPAKALADWSPGLGQGGPLMTTQWHQGEPYRRYCPEGDGGRTPVGCGPLAMAQVMRYHSWPPYGVGTVEYFWQGDRSCGGETEGAVLFADLTNPYDWDLMPDHCRMGCGSGQIAALAELCYEVGVACEARYGVCGTAISRDAARTVMTGRFRYATNPTWERRSNHTPESWHGLIRRDVDLGLPAFYFITGHLLVCDGWMELGGSRRIHVNWGDGGSPYSGWWDVDGLPTGQNPMSDQLLPGIRPLCEVAADGSGFFATIQDALEGAPAGAVIELQDGIYSGRGNHDLDVRGHNIEIRSASDHAGMCVLDCGGSETEPRRAFRIGSGASGRTVVRGITIRNGYAERGGAILIEGGSSPTLESLILENNTAGVGGAVASIGSSTQLRGVVLIGNRAMERGGGLYVKDGGASVVSSTLFRNQAPEGSGAHAGQDAGLDMSHCIVADGDGGAAIGADAAAELSLACCNLHGNEGGDWVGPVAHLRDVAGNMEADPLFCGPDEDDFGLHFLSPCAERNSAGCGQIGAFGTACGAGAVVVLQPDGNGLYPTIQAAVDAAYDGVVIELAPGVYSGQGNRDVLVMGKRLEFRGQTGDPADCIVDCLSAGDQRNRAFLIAQVNGPPVTFSGLTIRNGAVGNALDPGEMGGGAVRVQGAAAEFIDCVFENNSGVLPGGERGQGGAVLGQTAELTFTRCRFSGNQAVLGGAISIVGGSLKIDDCGFVYNSSAGSGGAVHVGRGGADLTGCALIANQAAGKGGGIYVDQGRASLVSSTLFRNRAPEGSGAHVERHAELLDLFRCIVAGGQQGAAIGGDEDALISVDCCNLFGNEGGDWAGPVAHLREAEGNLEADPLFCGPDEHDLGLHFLSPCTERNSADCGQIGAFGVSCGAGTVVVLNADGSGVYPTIQAAVDAAVDGVIIELAPGLYSGPGNHDVRISGKQLEFRGQTGDPADCVLDCAGGEGRRHRAFVLTGDSGGPPVLFSGLTIRNGAADGVTDPGEQGGGALRIRGMAAEFTDCVFERNSGLAAPGDTTGSGGAVLGRDARLSFTRCRFLENEAVHGGALAVNGGSLSLAGCELSLNQADRGGAVYAAGSSVFQAEGCTFAWNRALQGGALRGPLEPALAGCTFFGNDAADGSAFFGPESCLLMTQTIIAGGLGGEAIVCAGAPCHGIECTDIFGNAGGDWTGALSQYLDSDGNMNMDPLFCDPDSSDFRLDAVSPCVRNTPPNPQCGLIGAWPVGCESNGGEDPGGAGILLSRPQPNPSAGSVQFVCEILVADAPVPVILRIHDISGRRLWEYRAEFSAGKHFLEWDGRDSSGRRVASGVYMARIKAGGYGMTDRLVIMR